MNKIFSYFNELSYTPKAILIFTLSFSTLILLCLAVLKFTVNQTYIFEFTARYAIQVAAVLFLEGVVFSCIFQSGTKK